MKKSSLQNKNILNKIVFRRERQIFVVILGLFIFGAAVYLYSVGSVLFAIVERRYAERHVAELKSTISQLELSYLNQTKRITEKFAESQGFIEPESLVFQDRATRVATNVTREYGY